MNTKINGRPFFRHHFESTCSADIRSAFPWKTCNEKDTKQHKNLPFIFI